MVELLSGIPLFFQQYRALLKKNSILSLRNIKHTILQLFSSLFVLLLLFIVLESINLYLKKVISFENVSDPVVGVPSAIPPCEDKFFIFKPCYDFVWSGNHNPRIANIVNAIMRNNPLRPIADTRVKSFKTQEEVDEWLLSNPLRTPVALHFAERSPSVISYGIQTNTTALRRRAEDQDPIVTFQIPLQIAAEREIARFLLGDPNFSWTVGFKYPGTIYESTDVADDAQLSTLLIHLYRMIPLFTFVFQISSVVTEKELKLRQAMSMMGLYESAYWLSWFTWEAFFAMFSSLLTVLLGRLFKFNFFVDASFTLLFLTFFLFQISMIGFAFMLSTLISKSSRSTAWAFLIFIISAGTPNLTWLIYGTKKTIYVVLWNLFPPHLIYQAMNRMNTDDGKSWNKRRECTPSVHGECEITMEGILLRFLSALLFWFVLAIYLDNIIPNSNGVRKPVYYFILPSYWTGKGSTKEEEGSILKWIGAIPPIEEITPDDEDVLAEETLVKEQASKDEIDPDTAVQIRGLAKTYAKTLSFNFRSGFKLSKGFSAVKGIWVNLPKNQLFCLLGPNGAGKTTSISCLTGITPITGGDALIYGHSVRDTSSRSSIQKIMGVCPQFDILWGQLTGREHLHLFSNIKGLPPSMINSETEKALAEVKLTKFAKVRSASYSGGMKRRLSVAIALIGDPKLVFLDEPTTGMDPISRRHVWDIIEHAKKGRAIVLTTHAMEEADILSDRIAIMARGRLRCIGNSLRLKLRFGSGYIATVSFPSKDQESIQEADDDITDGGRPEAKPVKQFFRNYLELEPDEENEKFLNYIIPYEKKAVLTEFFSELEDRKEELGISDIQIGLTTLEEVFMNIVKKAEMEENENAPVAAVPDQGQ